MSILDGGRIIMKLNNDEMGVWHNCVDKVKGDCPFMKRNQYKVATCSIDGIVQVEFYGCVPQEIIDKKGAEEVL